MKHVERTKAGGWQYRRRVPKAVSAVIPKREFKQKLGDTESEARNAWPRVHAAVEREIAAAQRIAAHEEAVRRGEVTDREAYGAARLMVERWEAQDPSLTAATRERDVAADAILAAYPDDPETGEPVGVPDVDRHAVNLLRLEPHRTYQPPKVTLEDARKMYLAENPGGDEEARVNRVVGLVRGALGKRGESMALLNLTREDARIIRDHMLGRLKRTGKPVSPATVRRDMNTLRAILSVAAREFSFPATYKSPFDALPVTPKGARGGAEAAATERDRRLPLPDKVLGAVRERVLAGAIPELQLIWRLLEWTGCRLGEVVGLRVEDVTLAGETPNVLVTWHEGRRIKTAASLRHVPLVGDGLEAAREAVAAARERDPAGTMLFARYATPRGPDAVSAALMKHIRAVTTDPRYTVHSLRHNLKDKLQLAEVSSLDQNLILGHALGGVGDRVYGGTRVVLRVTTRAMRRALLGEDGGEP